MITQPFAHVLVSDLRLAYSPELQLHIKEDETVSLNCTCKLTVMQRPTFFL